MPDLVRIGYHPNTVSRTCARGYRVERRRCEVRIMWGKISVTGAGTSTFRWARTPGRRAYVRASVDGARTLARALVRVCAPLLVLSRLDSRG